ncbi:MAG: adenosylmethionine--8-amino-7-oxononanoate transaminase [Gammaproteobacteria bacterium]|nr:adenosylmethionine--8-amino-7-oxononanoate transaminase [Gammaproteobacteria bacterium]
MKERDRQLVERDRACVWHPYSSMVDAPPVFPVVSASGVRIRLADGRELIDGMASWWSAIHGYNHPELNRAIAAQLQSMAHVMFGGLTHEPAVRLAETLVDITPSGLETVFFSDSGSVSVEVAIKMAIQYQAARGKPEKQKLVALRGGYHGDTLGAMAVCDPVTGMHALFNQALTKHWFADRPKVRFGDAWNRRDVDSLTRILEERHAEIAALILEPIVQGAGGMWFYHPEFLRTARALCDAHDVLLIADEIATGFGRSGRLFACEHAGIASDILCLGKALTGGYMTLAATLVTRKVAEAISDGGRGTFMHGATFMASPLACATASASIDLLLSSDWRANVARIEKQLRTELEPCRGMPRVANVRVLGAIGVVEMEQPVDMRVVPHEFVRRGVWVRPFGKLVYVMPPYVIGAEDLSRVTSVICEVVSAP